MTTSEDVLNCPMGENDAGANTIRGYLVALLLELWHESEGFSGKRPFGNSGWDNEIYKALGQAGLIHCVIDEDGYVDSVDAITADKLIADAIRSLL